MIEQTYVLEGSLAAPKACAGPGNSSGVPRQPARGLAGPQGGLMLAMFQIHRTSSISPTGARPISSAGLGENLGAKLR